MSDASNVLDFEEWRERIMELRRQAAEGRGPVQPATYGWLLTDATWSFGDYPWCDYVHGDDKT